MLHKNVEQRNRTVSLRDLCHQLPNDSFTNMKSPESEPQKDNVLDDELIAAITPNVLACLSQQGFFEQLDDRFCPVDTSSARTSCQGDYRTSELILPSFGYDDAAVSDVVAVLEAQGACCDCEVLYNVAETSRLKSEYWRSRAAGIDSRTAHKPEN
jgi:Protein of unknown function (DUF2695)